VLVALAVEYFDDTLKDKEDVEHVLGLPTLGTVARHPGARATAPSIIALDDPFAPVTEAYRVARINIQFSTVVRGRSKTLLVTSAAPGEGKTTTAANLGVVMAQAGRKVVLVDADLRRPSLHRVFGIANQQGLTTLLLDDALAAETALVETRVRGLFVLPSGPLPPNRAELLGSERMRTRLEQLTEIADAVILDSPPILAVADTHALGTLASGVILVADSERTRSDLVRRGKEALEQVGLRLYGVILNKTSARRAPAYAYEYAHGEQRSGDAGEASEAPTEAKRGLRTWLGWVRG
jgi:capsular exopolysaccharide synthesis family protein